MSAVDGREGDQLHGLTQVEMELVREEIARRYPGVDVDVREVDAGCRSRRPGPLYVVTSPLARRIRNVAGLAGWRIAEDERAVADATLLESRMILRSQRFQVEGYDAIVRAEPAEWPIEISLRPEG